MRGQRLGSEEKGDEGFCGGHRAIREPAALSSEMHNTWMDIQDGPTNREVSTRNACLRAKHTKFTVDDTL